MSRRVLRDDALQDSFDRDGFVEVPMLDASQVAELRAAIPALRPADEWIPDGSGPAMNSYHCSFLDSDTGYKRAAYELLAEAFAGVIESRLADFRALSANFYSKPPGRGRIPVHQNWPVLEDLGATSVTVWCPLVDVDVDNGALHVVPGSHKLVQHVEGPRSPSYFAGFEEDLDDCLKPLPARAGTGFIFDDSIVHGSPNNISGEPRLAVQITCVPTEARPVFWFRSDNDDRFELVEADTDFYLDYSVAELGQRQPGWTSRTSVASRNRALSKPEFLALLGRAPAPAEPRGQSRMRALIGRLLGA